jgi:hypothetical protein
MTRSLAVLSLLVVMLGCGTDDGNSAGDQTFALAIEDGRQVTAPAGSTTYVFLTALGSNGQAVAFAVENLPTFVTLSGDYMAIAPKSEDVGQYEVVVTASAGASSDTKRLVIVVQSNADPIIGRWKNTDPYMGPYLCEFSASGAWGGYGCQFGSGWSSTWQRTGPGEYAFSFSNGTPCGGRATFSENGNALTLSVSCATPDWRSYSYVRVP